MTKITMDGQYQTRDGRKVRVLCVDRAEEERPVVVLIADQWGKEHVYGVSIYGHYWPGFPKNEHMPDPKDLIPIPKKIRVRFWVNVYKQGDAGTTYDTKAEADEAGGKRFACIEIDREVTEGEGL